MYYSRAFWSLILRDWEIDREDELDQFLSNDIDTINSLITNWNRTIER